MGTKHFKLRILHWNANSIQRNFAELYQELENKHIHIACISETFLKPNNKLHANPDYFIYRLDRTITTKGGVAILVRKNIKHKLKPCLTTQIIETISIEVQLKDGSFVDVHSVYLPGGATNHEINQHFRSDIRKITHTNRTFFACGDLNAKHLNWNNQSANLAGRLLADELTRGCFFIAYPPNHTYIPTDNNRNPSTIDITLTNSPFPLASRELNSLISDHKAVLVEVHESEPSHNPPSLVPDYKNANWNLYRTHIHKHIGPPNENNLINSPNDIEEAVENLTSLMIHARDKAVPLKSHDQYKLTLSNDLLDIIKIKNQLHRQWQRTRDPRTKNQVNHLRKKIANEVAKQRNINWNAKLSEIKPSNNALWTTTRKLKNTNNQIQNLQINNKQLVTNQEKSEAIAEVFAANHENPLKDEDINFSTHVANTVRSYNPTQGEPNLPSKDEIKMIIKNLKNPKAPGNDRINNTLIKRLPSRAIETLENIYKACIIQSYFPTGWKHAKVIPIHKPSKPKTDPASYRPISLLSSLSKILERLLLNRINDHLEDHQIIPQEQCGFRAKRSTIHQLNRVIQHAKSNLENNHASTGIILMDVEKAFDRVWHNGLIFKMIKLKFPTYLIKITKSFLTNRTFQVAVNGAHSAPHNIPFGVPQGAVLSPTLYNIYTHDIPSNFNAEIALFADDTAIYYSSPQYTIIENNISDACSKVANYMHKWKINLNKAKTQALFVTRRRTKELPNNTLRIFNEDIKWVEEAKYLGIILDKRLTFKKHIEYTIKKANVALVTLYPLIGRKASLNRKNKLLLYKLAVRPILSYGCPALTGIAKTNTRKMQRLQNKFIKIILNKPWFENTDSIHQDTNIQFLEHYFRKLCDSFESRNRELLIN